MTARQTALWLLLAGVLPAQTLDWDRINEETMRHFQALIRIDTTDPPGNEKPAVDYLKAVLDGEGIPTKVLALDEKRPNLVARLAGNGAKRPVLIMGHTDVVNIDPRKWKFPPFGAVRDGGYVYGRGTVDDKDNVVACLMTMLLLKRLKVPLERDVIFLAEAGEEGAVRYGIKYMVENHYAEIDAEYCLAEGGGAVRTGGKPRYVTIATTEKIPYALKLVARGPAGHGSRPLRTNAILHLSEAVSKVSRWMPPMRLNDTTRAYFERLATISTPEEAARYNGILHPEKTAAIQEYFAQYEPGHNSMLRTSISPNIFRAGYRINVIPSEAEAMLDVRALPDEDLGAFVEQVRKVINDPQVEVVRESRDTRPAAPPSRLDTEAFRVLETVARRSYPGMIVLPTMLTGATDMAYLRARGMQCYGVGPMTDSEDGPKGFGAHSDQERILETALYTFVRFHYEAVEALARRKP
ncbi:MAG: M20/M25/M40 family metallo-hydrolase [Bryobacteraceae bacterium]|nr:M20/M25/M40 family metallo-hydrolase [Bryobacteraceae bacterium]MDW8378462.1 M20/M25/M40 family metallo-hydrolase [Bryobacterales bacterium]